jgi:cobalt-zinc-cadmium resistance protein CzcA
VALAGASMLEGLALVSAIRDRMAHGVPKREAIEQARLARLRPVLMTGIVAALGFVPMMVSTGIGAEVQRPLATVVLFGVACDTFLTMLALLVLYLLFGKGPRSDVRFEEGNGGALATVGHQLQAVGLWRYLSDKAATNFRRIACNRPTTCALFKL